MNRTRTVLLAAAVASAMLVGGVVTASALSNSPLGNVLAAASPSPSSGTFKSNEDATHEKGESAAQEAAENNGTFHPGGPGGLGGPGKQASNEDPTHEKSESAAREAAENS
ncbi:MAG TPA: hypothetical protein VKT20_06750 [Candidatus Dormibacteraeota bacterium]|nr:hypothetical protein [Candidatus Dormibacteraeota bacterium]